MIRKIILFLIVITTIGCSSTKEINKITVKEISSMPIVKIKDNLPTTNLTINKIYISKTTNNYIKDYIIQYNEIAMYNMKNYNIPASIILAQGILESGAGQGFLPINAFNHFGIKCHNTWSGEVVYKDDDKPNECFRKYNNLSESYRDHAEFLIGKKRYAKLFTLPKGDYKKWAYGLRKAGYATDPKYPNKLINFIETYHLYEYDEKVLSNN